MKNPFTHNIELKITSLILALALWFYIVGELNKGSEQEKQFLNKILPADGVVARKLVIRPIFVGKPRYGYYIDTKRVLANPDYCIVVGPREMLGKIKYVFTTPIDVSGLSKPFAKSVPLNPIAPGVFMEETLVQVTVPVEKSS